MADYFEQLPVNEEQFAAWLDGTLSLDEEQLFMQEYALNPDMQMLFDANDNIDDTYEDMVSNGYEMPDELMTDFSLPEISAFDDDIEFSFDDDLTAYVGDDNDNDVDVAEYVDDDDVSCEDTVSTDNDFADDDSDMPNDDVSMFFI